MVSFPNEHTNFEMLKQKILTLHLSEKNPVFCHFEALRGRGMDKGTAKDFFPTFRDKERGTQSLQLAGCLYQS